MKKFAIFLIGLSLLFSNVYAQTKIKFTLSDIFGSYKFMGRSLSGRYWLSDSSGLIYKQHDRENGVTNFIKYDFESGTESIFVNGNDIIDPQTGKPFKLNYTGWSQDDSMLLFTDLVRARTTKTSGNFYVYRIADKKLTQMTNQESEQLNIEFSPDSKNIGFVRNNNLYVINVIDKTEKQLTFDGSADILNGHFDWVYEEEFSVIKAWEWSPDSRHIAFWRTDQSNVPEYYIPRFDSLYTEPELMKYPKSGQMNSNIRIGIIETSTGKTKWVADADGESEYIPLIKWLPASGELLILKMNRLQNHMEFFKSDPVSGHSEKMFELRDEKWISVENEDWQFPKKSPHIVFTSETGGNRHIYKYDYKSNRLEQVTAGSWDVRKIAGIDELNKEIYFTAARPTPIYNHIFKTSYSGSEITMISAENGWHDPEFSRDCAYYFNGFSRAAVPGKYSLHKADGRLVKLFIDNNTEERQQYEIAIPEFFSFTTSDGVDLNGWMLKPSDFSETKKHPVFMYVYGGPDSQTARDFSRSGSSWHQYLAQNGYIVVSVDGRGTGGRGSDFKKSVYKNLGYWEANDQIEAAAYLGSLPFIDSKRIGIYGWSYGGTVAALSLFKGRGVFSAAIAVAPVTDWRYYDTIYTERYMQTPELNPIGYENSSLMKYVKNMEGKLLLVHGMADDNVHFQNSTALVDELISQNKQFEMMFYPDRRHGIMEKSYNTRLHVFTKITDFIFKNI